MFDERLFRTKINFKHFDKFDKFAKVFALSC